MSSSVLRSLYRSLLRASSHFSPPSPNATVLASLLHRSGISHDWDECVYRLETERRAANNDNKTTNDALPKDWAMNLTRSYPDLKEEYDLRRELFHRRVGHYDSDDPSEDEETFVNMAMGSSHYRTNKDELRAAQSFDSEEDPKVVLFRHLLREWFAGQKDNNNNNNNNPTQRKWTMNEEGFIQNGAVRQVPYMRFPSQISADEMSLLDFVRREFRAPTVEERLTNEVPTITTTTTTTTTTSDAGKETTKVSQYFPPSSYIDNKYRIQTAFYTLMELNRKLVWADKLGLLGRERNTIEIVQQRHFKRLAQAAKGISCFPEARSTDAYPNNGSQDTKVANVSKNIQCGTYLIAHPLMTGYFAKSVIIILDHTEVSSEMKNNTLTSTKEESGPGGTYGLIVNRIALQPVAREKQLEIIRQRLEEINDQSKEKDSSYVRTPPIPSNTNRSASYLLRPISLTQAIVSNDLPETVVHSFGDSPVREGGPVNLSLQMIHRKCPSTKSDNVMITLQEKQLEKLEETIEKGNEEDKGLHGTIITSLEENENETIDTDAIYFGGDVIQASLAVTNGIQDQGDYSFFIGASCWSPGQLEREIERGCWLPFRGPPSMAMTGMCEHNDTITNCSVTGNKDINESTPTVISHYTENRKVMLNTYPPRPSNSTYLMESSKYGTERPITDLYLSIMCALGEGEGDLAYALLDDNKIVDELGDTCDNFDR